MTVLWLVPWSRAGQLAYLLAVIVLGVWSAGRLERRLGRKDPGVIVIDEVAGMTLSVLWLPVTWATLGTGFVLFRLFDVWKPFPARAAERAGGGLGVVLDDLVAAAYALGGTVALRGLGLLP